MTDSKKSEWAAGINANVGMSGGAGKNASEGGIPPELETRVAASETRITKAIFPFNTNHHDTLFGGDALSWMDETAFIAATRFARKSLVTVSTDRIDFRAAIPGGSLVEFVARVSHVGRTSVRVQVDAWLESMYREGREHAISGCFTMVAVDADKRPIPVL